MRFIKKRRISDSVVLARVFLGLIICVALGSAIANVAPSALTLAPCPILAMTGIECPGCGMSRACISLVSANFSAAWHYHPLSFFIILLAAGFAFVPQTTRRLWQKCSPAFRNTSIGLMLVATLAHWILRLCGG